MVAAGNFLGCPYVSTAVELKNPEHPGSVVARHFKQQLTDFFHRELVKAGVEDPDTLAIQLTIIFDGASARAVVGRSRWPAGRRHHRGRACWTRPPRPAAS